MRFLSFLGIGQNVKHCAFIMHTAQDQFIAHIFYCEPSSGALCKTIEAACKVSLREGCAAIGRWREVRGSHELRLGGSSIRERAFPAQYLALLWVLTSLFFLSFQLRYQKCLDAHPGGGGRGRGEAPPRSLSATLRSVFTTFAGRKARSTES